MFERIIHAWNLRTPEYLHPYTKANLVWQLKLTVLLFFGLYAYDKYKEVRDQRKNAEPHLKAV